jgi:hypothetical protein
MKKISKKRKKNFLINMNKWIKNKKLLKFL